MFIMKLFIYIVKLNVLFLIILICIFIIQPNHNNVKLNDFFRIINNSKDYYSCNLFKN